MSNLPNPRTFGSFKAELSKTINFDSTRPKYDLEKIYQTMKANVIPKGFISQLLDVEVLNSFDNTQEVLKRCILFDKINNSAAIAIKEDEKIKAIAIHKSIDKEGNAVKWVTLGSKSYIPFKIRDEAKIVLLLVGMKEYLLMELLEHLDYICPQSDSIVKGLNRNEQWINEIRPKLKGKLVVYINENDESSRELIHPLKEEHPNILNIDINDFYLFHIIGAGNGGADTELPRGFDMVDLINMFKNDVSSIFSSLKEYIQMEVSK